LTRLDEIRSKFMGQMLSTARAKAGLTQSQLAMKLDRSQAWVSKYEAGEQKLTVLDLLTICEALHLNVLDVIRGLRGSEPRAAPDPHGQ
jgi:transcriptional regulator with XRE-family HTH domain